MLIAIVIAFIGGYLNSLGVKWFPAFSNYVDNVVAVIMIVPLIFFVFVPLFEAISDDENKKK